MNVFIVVVSLLTIAAVAIFGAKIMATQAEHEQALNAISEQITKGINEVVAAVGNSGNTTPEVDAAANKLRGLAQQLDDVNQDTPTP